MLVHLYRLHHNGTDMVTEFMGAFESEVQTEEIKKRNPGNSWMTSLNEPAIRPDNNRILIHAL